MEPSLLKTLFRRVRAVGTFWIAEPSLKHLEAIRAYELSVVCELLPTSGRLLEIGAGAGWQAKALEAKGYEVSGIDIPSSNYRSEIIWPVTEYDGHRIPFEDQTFDIIFSSNTLEHIPHVVDFQKEILRVLKPGGMVIHLVPSGTWRFWTNLTHLLKRWNFPDVHGELAGNSLSEIYFFSRHWWTQLFQMSGWVISQRRSNRLFYTGHSIMDSRLSMGVRRWLSRILGGSCNLFVLRRL